MLTKLTDLRKQYEHEAKKEIKKHIDPIKKDILLDEPDTKYIWFMKDTNGGVEIIYLNAEKGRIKSEIYVSNFDILTTICLEVIESKLAGIMVKI